VSTDRRLQGGIAWVTGGGAGIGRACALRLAAEGADVAISTIVPAEAEAVRLELERLGVRAHVTITDMRDPDAIVAAHAEIAATLGDPTILVNNVGNNQRDVGFLTDTEEVFAAVWSLNVMSAIRSARAVLPAMVARNAGAIINMASVHGYIAFPHSSAYAAGKGAMIAWTRNLAREFGPHGVRVNALAPGAIDTPLQRRSLAQAIAAGISEEEFNRRAGDVGQMARMADADEVAAVVAFLASDDAAMITGMTMAVDGGAIAKAY